MSTYILRHELRNPDNPLFHSPLTTEGEENAIKLVDTIKALNIETIYSSPFLRTIQTVYPYCVATGTVVNVDNALYESMDNPMFNESNSRYEWKDLPERYHAVINPLYCSYNCSVPERNESFDKICKRVAPFIESSMDSNKNIMLVTPLTTAKAIQRLIDPADNRQLGMGCLIEVAAGRGKK